MREGNIKLIYLLSVCLVCEGCIHIIEGDDDDGADFFFYYYKKEKEQKLTAAIL